MRNKNGVWTGIKRDKFAIPRARRWTQHRKLEDIAVAVEQVAEFFTPKVIGDTISTVQGFLQVKLNRHLGYDSRVTSQMYWIENRHIMAIRVVVLTRKLITSSRQSSYSRSSHITPETILEAEQTWFLGHHMSNGNYYWTDCNYEGTAILDRIRTMTELRFD